MCHHHHRNPGLGRPPKFLKSSPLTTTFSDKIEWPKGALLQSTAKIVGQNSAGYPGLYPNNLKKLTKFLIFSGLTDLHVLK